MVVRRKQGDIVRIHSIAWDMAQRPAGYYDFSSMVNMSESMRLKDGLVRQYSARNVNISDIYNEYLNLYLSGMRIDAILKSICERFESKLVILQGVQTFETPYTDEDSKISLIISRLAENCVVVCI